MTVSLALRNHPSISTATRSRIQRLAAESGYRPDPMVNKLMHHLRTRRVTRYQATLCCLRSQASQEERDYGDEIEAGARKQAEALGFGFESMWLSGIESENRSLDRILRSRGIEGLILLPMARTESLVHAVEWNNFSVVTTTFSVLSPHFHGVIPDQFGNMMKLCQYLVEMGWQRVGLVTQISHDIRVNHRFTAALAWHTLYASLQPTAPFLAPKWPPDKESLIEWFAETKPQVLVADSVHRADFLRNVFPQKGKNPLPVFCTGLLHEREIYHGIDEKPREIGAVAVGILAEQLQRGIKGIPTVPHLTMIEGSLTVNRSRKRNPQKKDGVTQTQ